LLAPQSGAADIFDRAMDDLRTAGEWRGDFRAKRKNSTTFGCLAQAVSMDLSGKPHRLFLMAAGAEPAAAVHAAEAAPESPAAS
jgi:hypothetical protein